MGHLVDRMNRFDVFKGKRIFITGDTGFKGSWLALWLTELGANVVGYALPPKHKHDHFNLLQLEKRMHHVDGDIRDLPFLSKVVEEFQPEFLFHLAAQPLVRFSYENPKETLDTNIGGSVNLLEVARQSKTLRAMIYVTSDKCYKNMELTRGYREDDPLGGRDPYSASKAAAEIVFESYVYSFFDHKPDFGIVSTRAGNVVGGGDWSEDRIVPDCVKSLLGKEPILLRNPSSTRPWQHVLEPLSGYLLLAVNLYQHPKKFSGAWNFGPNEEAIHTVEDLAKRVVAYWGSGHIEMGSVRKGTHYEAQLLHLNCDKARNLLGWNSRWDFDRTVEETVSWYRAVAAGEPTLTISKQQIQAYLESE